MCYRIVFLLLLLTLSPLRADPEIRNVLFLVADDLKASVLGCYGDEVCATPHLDALAARSMVFDRAYCQGTWCQPSRESFMHSRYVGDHGPTLGKHLIDQGFYSARVGKIFHMRVPGDIIDGTDGNDVPDTWTEKFNCRGQEAHTPGLYRLLNQNIETRALENRQSTKMPFRMFASVESDGDGTEQPDWKAAGKTVELLKKHGKSDKPFFLATGFVRPHYPSVAPASYFEDYPISKIDAPEVPEGDLSDIPKPARAGSTSENTGISKFPDNIKRMWSDYYATVTFMDEQLGRVMNELDRQGLRDSTLVIFASDHGYHLGEHHFWQKSKFHEEVTRVPLMVAAPGFETGRTKALAELVDIYPTVCDLVGVGMPDSVQGKSLRPVLRDPGASVREVAYSTNRKQGDFVRSDRWAYMKYHDGSEELYDMEKDPGQFTNLAGMKAVAAEQAMMAVFLEGRMAEAVPK
ncbi:MAG: sulfatase [Verrucomicrobiales bacterium]|nr:sulfatase [Verrucomicrobiales bacterium]